MSDRRLSGGVIESAYYRWGAFVARRYRWVLFFWLALTILLRMIAPDWRDIAHDGDLAHLPEYTPSVQGERMLERSFPDRRARSHLAIVAAHPSRPLDAKEVFGPLYDLAWRLKNLEGVAHWQRAANWRKAADQAQSSVQSEALAGNLAQHQQELELGEAALNEAVELASQWAANLSQDDEHEAAEEQALRRLGGIFLNRALIKSAAGRVEEALADREQAVALDPELENRTTTVPDDVPGGPLLGVWTWKDSVFGEKLTSRDQRARVAVMLLESEFLATSNLPLMEWLDQQVRQIRVEARQQGMVDLQLEISGSAAVGADMLRSARDGIRYTETCTVVLVLIILSLIYRSPLLVAIPLITIAVSLACSVGVVALLCQVDPQGSLSLAHLKVFTTTKVFVVVILFGAGTDFCLFMISRYREELRHDVDISRALAGTLAGVGNAITASALTTILALAAMAAADYEKYKYSGPTIGLSLLVTLLVCLTLTPALLRAVGLSVFWPGRVVAGRKTIISDAARLWAARRITQRPGLILLVSVAMFAPLAWMGWGAEKNVSYDILASLDPQAPGRRGAELLRQHFPVGESGPLVVLVELEGAQFGLPEGNARIAALTGVLSSLPGIQAVRSFVDPLGDFPPDQAVSLLTREAWFNRISRLHRVTERLYLSQNPQSKGSIARLDLVLEHDPFTLAAAADVRRVQQQLERLAKDDPDWMGARFLYAGMPGGLRDLRDVTSRDHRLIKTLVVIVVLLVLWALLRRPIVCIYLVASVLFSYYATIGATGLFFGWCYGPDYQGLDWKTPLFVFVILVAVGQDYNVYLATRVFEEQRKLGPLLGLQVALARTCGIITSCGVIMAGAFLTMTSGAWVVWLQRVKPGWFEWLGQPTLQTAMLQLGFALSLGILIDTFIVRPVLVPAFLALLARRQAPNH